MWQDLPPEWLVQASLDNSTGLPGMGSNLTIPSSWTVQLDTDTAELWHLELQGALVFSEEQATSLTTHSLAMPLGTMTAGNSTHPHPAPVRNLAPQPPSPLFYINEQIGNAIHHSFYLFHIFPNGTIICPLPTKDAYTVAYFR